VPDERDTRLLRRAIDLARDSEAEGNLPVGAVVGLDGEVIAEGKSRVVEPAYHPGRHAEMEALEAVPTELWPRADEMTCYTTLEPCVMCAGALLLHGVGRVVFGACDELGGAGETLEHLPAYYDEADVYAWNGPVMAEVCRPLGERAREAFDELPVGRGRDRGADGGETRPFRERLDGWMESVSGAMSVPDAREATSRWADRLEVDELDAVLPYAVEIFERGGYLKDFRNLEEYARRAGDLEVLEVVEETLREELPDVWVRRALERGDRATAIERWFEIEDHARARLVADELAGVCDRNQIHVLISCRLAEIAHLVERGSRRRYRRACDILRKLRDELERAGESAYWRGVIEDLTDRYDNRPAWLDELQKADLA